MNTSTRCKSAACMHRRTASTRCRRDVSTYRCCSCGGKSGGGFSAAAYIRPTCSARLRKLWGREHDWQCTVKVMEKVHMSLAARCSCHGTCAKITDKALVNSMGHLPRHQLSHGQKDCACAHFFMCPSWAVTRLQHTFSLRMCT